jgi:transposase
MNIGPLLKFHGTRDILSILVIVWYLLSDPEVGFHDLGSGYYDSRINPEHKKRNHIRQLEALGYKVTLEPAA